METLLQNLDARMANIEQILPTLATRDGLATFDRGLRTDLTEQIRSSAQAVGTELTERIESSARAVRADLTERIESSARAVRADLTEQIHSSANGLRVLIEASRDDSRVLAEHVLDLMTRLPREQ
jgi:hypothetical protein